MKVRRSSRRLATAQIGVVLFLLLSPAPGEVQAVAHGQASGDGGAKSEAGESDSEDVGVDTTSGAATLSIPVDLPPGPNGLKPSLSLSYSSQRGNGMLGVGWDVSVPSVKCSMKFGLPDSGYQSCERFELAGQILVGPDTSTVPQTWHTFTESFMKIVREETTENDRWLATDGNGTTMEFGGPTAYRVIQGGGTAEWLLKSITDSFQNSVDFTYELGPAPDEGLPRLKEITYAGDTRTIEFHYEGRDDPIRNYEGGIKRVSTERLQEIRVLVNGDLHHRLMLTYDSSTLTNVSRLRSVQRFGADCDPASFSPPTQGSACAKLPAATFGYADTGAVDATLRWQAMNAPGTAAQSTSWGSNAEPVPDWYAPADAMFSTNSPFMSGLVTQTADVNGDGLIDLITDFPHRADQPVPNDPNEDFTLYPYFQPYGYEDAMDPVVMINNGVDGWDYPDGSNKSWEWTQAIRGIQFDIPTITVKQVESVDPQEHYGHSNSSDNFVTMSLGTCIEPPESPPTVVWKTVGNVQFAGPNRREVAPFYDSTMYRNHTNDMCRNHISSNPIDPLCEASRTGVNSHNTPDGSIPVETEIRAWPQFQFVDLNSDGLSDLVMSVHLSGFNLSFNDCANPVLPPVGTETWVDGASARYVMMNTGSGWSVDDARSTTDGIVADSLPPFSIVAFESSDLVLTRLDQLREDAYSSPCDDVGLAGVRGINHSAMGVPYAPRSADFCVAGFDLAPLFTDLNGDGYPDIVVTETADVDALFHNNPHMSASDWRTSASIKSVAYIQNPHPQGVEKHWIRSEAYDPPLPHANVMQALNESGWTPSSGVGSSEIGKHQSWNIDHGVRFADLNRDGLSDIVQAAGTEWWDGAVQSSWDSVAALNVGARIDGAPHSAWCVSRETEWTVAGVSVCNDAGAYELPVSAIRWVVGIFLQSSPELMGTTAPKTDSFQFHLADVNGDGWTDFLISEQPDGSGSLEGPAVYLHQPGDAGSVWQEAVGYLSPGINALRWDNVPSSGFSYQHDWQPMKPSPGLGFFDANGDGVLDFIGSDRQEFPNRGSWVSAADGARSDLLVEYKNGRGVKVELEYASAIQQRNPVREAKAEAHAIAPLSDADPDTNHLAEEPGYDGTHWPTSAVLVSKTVSSPLLEVPSTTDYFYAHPRRCHDHKADLGFRFVESQRADSSRVESYFFQDHGRTGQLAQRIVFDEFDAPVHFAKTDWRVIDDPSDVTGGFSGAAGVFDRAYIGRPYRSMSRNEYGAAVGDDPGYTSASRTIYDDDHGYNFAATIYNDSPGRRTRTERSPAGVDLQYYLPNRVWQTEVYANQGTDQRLLSRTQLFYAGHDTVEDPRKVGRRVDLIQDRDSPAGWDERWTYYDYSVEGNLIQERVQLEASAGGDGQITSYCYDGDSGCEFGQGSHSLVVETIDALGNSTYTEPHSVFAATIRSSSDYLDVPTIATDLDPLGRVKKTWWEYSGGGAPVALTDTEYHDFPTDGFDYDGGHQPFVVSRQFATAAAAGANSVSAAESLTVDGGGGSPVLQIDLLVGSGGTATAVGTESTRDPVDRTSWSSEPFACGSAAIGAAPDYFAAINLCEGVGAAAKTGIVATADAMSRPVHVQTPLGFEVFAYSAESIEVVGEGGPNPHDLSFHKNANGGLQQRVLAAGAPVRIRDCNNALNPALATLPSPANGCDSPHESRLVYEPTGELRARVDPTAAMDSWLGGTSSLPASQHITYLRDTVGQIVEIQDPDAGVSSQTYDRLGRLESSIDARGFEVRNEYDILNRLIKIETDDPNETPTTITYEADLLQQKRLVDGALGDFDKLFFYDDFGRPTKIVRWVDGHQMMMNYDYDLMGRPTMIQYPTVLEGEIDRVAYEYEGSFLSRVCDVGDDLGDCDGASATTIVSSVDFDPLGRVKTIHIPGGPRSFTYDGNSARRTSDVFDATSGDDISYKYFADAQETIPAYDPLGNLTHVSASVGSGSGADTFTHDYTFDARNRIDTWAWNNEPTPKQFVYDARGNMTSHQGNSQDFNAPTGAWSNDTKDRAHAIRQRIEDGVSYRYDYDASGNLMTASGPGWLKHHTFDHRGRLACVGTTAGSCDTLSVKYRGDGERAKEVGSSTFYYAGADFRVEMAGSAIDEYWIEVHALGQRVAYKHVSGGALRLVEVFPTWEPPAWLRPLLETLLWLALLAVLAIAVVTITTAPLPVRAAFSLSAMVLAAVVPVQVWAGGGITNPNVSGSAAFRWVMTDMIGSGMAEVGEAGQRLMYETYTPFGREFPEGGESSPLLESRRYYAGHDRQTDVGLVYMNARWMDPGSGTFVSVDPVVRSATAAQSFNGYAYVENNPISQIDPQGTNMFVALSQMASAMNSGGGGGGGHTQNGYIDLATGKVVENAPDGQLGAGEMVDGGAIGPGGGVHVGGVDSTSPLAPNGPKVPGPQTTSQSGSRVDAVVAGGGGNFVVDENPGADSNAPWYEVGALGDLAVRGRESLIERAAAEAGLSDVNLLKTAVWLENSHGYYDSVAGPFASSLRPANINVSVWGDAFGLSRGQLLNPLINLRAGATILSGIQANLSGSNIRAIGTLYNDLNATRVSNYGARFGAIYSSQPWR